MASICVVVPVAPDRRHLAPALPQELLDGLGVVEQVTARDPRPVAAVALDAVALRTAGLPRLLAERGRPRSLLLGPIGEPGVELGRGHHLDRREHLRVVDPAELRALAEEDPRLLRLEPRPVHGSGNGVELSAELRDPPRVDDVPVRRSDEELDGPALRRSHPVHRDDAVRVPVLPRELRADDLDDEVLLAAGRGRHVLDDRQLDEHEGSDRAQDEHRSDRPGQLQPVRPVDLRPVGIAGATPSPVPDDEEDQQALDEHEDREGKGRDEPVALADRLGVRRLGCHRREAAVPAECDRRIGDERDERAEDGDGVPPGRHGAGIL